ncbi:MAG: hypothetical protein COB22_00790 [Cycloclasticus sp.]|nr:MAG: hypothetical protein COB22_00790 [Cycloclasticus sp.]
MLEPIDSDYWRDEDVLTVWQAAFAMCNLEPWEEPISTNARPPEKVEKMRTVLLDNIAHYLTGDVFAQSGWSCKTRRPMQLSGLYFSRHSLSQWAKTQLPMDNTPLFLSAPFRLTCSINTISRL